MVRGMDKAVVMMRMLCVIALACLSFAHRPALAAPLSPAELAAITLPDGTVADICFSDGVGHAKTKGTYGRDCEACRIGAGLLLPQPSDVAGDVIAFAEVGDRPLIEAAVQGHRFQPGAPPTAPPHPAISM